MHACVCANKRNAPSLDVGLDLLHDLIVRAVTRRVVRMRPRDLVARVVRLHALDRVEGDELAALHVADEHGACTKQARVRARFGLEYRDQG